MHTITVKLERTGASSGYGLVANTEYIASCDEQPSDNLKIDCDQENFTRFKEMLRYFGVDEATRQQGISFFQKLMTKVFDDIRSLSVEIARYPDEPLHLRLLVDAKELVQLPFELTLNPKGVSGPPSGSFLLNQGRIITMTRAVKQTGYSDFIWPTKPRILFAAAGPSRAVPFEAHFISLRNIIKEMVSPDESSAEPIADIPSMITLISKASLKAINEKIKEAIRDNRPYTHVHILAHGTKAEGCANPEEFRLRLHDNNDETKHYDATGTMLAMSILEMDDSKTQYPAIVSLMVCDSGNTNDVTLPGGSLANQLHENGIPCVFASQFPLNVEGSVKLVSTLYRKLLIEGHDPRIALYFTRKALVEENNHDWASLIVHVHFPKDIDQQMKAYRLKVMLGNLETISAWVEHLLAHEKAIPADKLLENFDKITDRLYSAIKDLDSLFREGKIANQGEDSYAEQSGLIASAYKREAEHFFRLMEFRIEMKQALMQKSKEALNSARAWYFAGFESVRHNHWTGIQYLSLTAVINKSFEEEDKKFMTVVEVMATGDTKETNDPEARIWAWGTLMELYLLHPLLASADQIDAEAPTALKTAKQYVRNIAKSNFTFINDRRITKDKIIFAKKSTARQLARYIVWWPVLYPSPQLLKLKGMASELLAELNV